MKRHKILRQIEFIYDMSSCNKNALINRKNNIFSIGINTKNYFSSYTQSFVTKTIKYEENKNTFSEYCVSAKDIFYYYYLPRSRYFL